MEKMWSASRRVEVTYAYTDDRGRTRVGVVSAQWPRVDRKSGGTQDDGADAAREAAAMGMIPADHVEVRVLDVEVHSVIDLVPMPDEAFAGWHPDDPALWQV